MRVSDEIIRSRSSVVGGSRESGLSAVTQFIGNCVRPQSRQKTEIFSVRQWTKSWSVTALVTVTVNDMATDEKLPKRSARKR
jgi:hypothetical protein